ncbi:hypothetical protein caldi_08450 [Caldinitratiruptor microaerophilus]|uniref:Uncharacterized protein n=1 Tax=Caldinitratiruptor microaerophilus TaxID=671077 RepID=A0AA35CM08_9FIRM|nr:hypothetical protein caldi_08450 [Caldinitratiruptor microaerophilus]
MALVLLAASPAAAGKSLTQQLAEQKVKYEEAKKRGDTAAMEAAHRRTNELRAQGANESKAMDLYRQMTSGGGGSSGRPGGGGGSSSGGSAGRSSSPTSGSSAFDRMEKAVQQAKQDWQTAYDAFRAAQARDDAAAMQAAQQRMNEAHERAERARSDYSRSTGLQPPEWLLSTGTGRREDYTSGSGAGGQAGRSDRYPTGGAGSLYQPPESYARIGYGALAGFTPLLVDGKPLIGSDGQPVMVAQFAANQNKGSGGTISAIPTDKLTPEQLRRFRDAGFAVEGNMILVSAHYYAATGTGSSGPKADVGWKASAPRELNMVTPVGAVSPEVADTLLSTFPGGWSWSYDTRAGIIRTPGGIVDISLNSPGRGGSGVGSGPGVTITPPDTVPVSILSVTVTPNPVTEGQTLTVTAKTMGPVTQGLATFGWGQQSRLSGSGDTWTATVTAPAAPQEKTYPITVVVAGDRGQTATRQASVTVRPAPPSVRSVTLSPNPIKFADILTVSVELTGRAASVSAYVQYRRSDYEQKGGNPVITLTQVSGQAPGTTVWRGTKKVDWITLDEWQDVMAERTLDPYTVTVTADGPAGRDTAPGQVTIQGTTIWVVPVPD